MRFFPINKTLLVEPITEKMSDLIPEELREKASFTACKVLEGAQDCEKIWLHGAIPGGIAGRLIMTKNSLIVVRTEGLEEVRFRGEIFIIVSEKFVVGEIDYGEVRRQDTV